MYKLARKVDSIRKRLKVWCLDKRLFWGFNWRKMFCELQHQGNQVQTINQGVSLVSRHRSLITEASLAVTYWHQRIKERHLQLGDIPSKFLFNRLRQKKYQNYVYMLRNSSGNWVENQVEIAQMIQSYFKTLYQAEDTDYSTNTNREEQIDMVLSDLNLPHVSNDQAHKLSEPISDQEIRAAMFDLANDKSPGIDGIPSKF